MGGYNDKLDLLFLRLYSGLSNHQRHFCALTHLVFTQMTRQGEHNNKRLAAGWLRITNIWLPPKYADIWRNLIAGHGDARGALTALMQLWEKHNDK